MINNDSFTPDELELIERLRKTPRPELRPQAVDAIERLLHQGITANPAPVRPSLRPAVVATVLVILALLAAVVGLITFQRNGTPDPSATPTSSMTQTQVMS